MIKSTKQNYFLLFLLTVSLFTPAAAQQTKRKTVHIFLDIRENNLDKPSTVAENTLGERLIAAGFQVTTRRREADLVVEGTVSSRPTPVTDDAKREGGVNAEAAASVRLLSGAEVIATSVERTSPGDWGVQAERVGEDRLIEVAGRVADDMFSGEFFKEVTGFEVGASPKPESRQAKEKVTVIDVGASPKPESRQVMEEFSVIEVEVLPKPQSRQVKARDIQVGGTTKPESRQVKTARKPAGAKRGVSFLEVVSLVQNFAPEDRIVAALRKYGIKFKPREVAINQLRSLGASEAVLSAVKTSNVV